MKDTYYQQWIICGRGVICWRAYASLAYRLDPLFLSLSRKEKIHSNHKTTGSPSLNHIYTLLQPADPNTSNHV